MSTKMKKSESGENQGEDMDISERVDIQKTMLGILTANSLTKMTAAVARNRLEEELEEKFETAEQKRQLRLVIKRLFQENSRKFTQYKSKSPIRKSITKTRDTATKKKTTKSSPKKKAKSKKPAAEKIYDVSDTLKKIVHIERGERREISAALWAYIKEQKLQNPNNRTKIRTDDLLKEVCGGESTITTLQVTRHITNNITLSENQSPIPKAPETTNGTADENAASSADGAEDGEGEECEEVVNGASATDKLGEMGGLPIMPESKKNVKLVKDEPKEDSDDYSDSDTDEEDFVQKKRK